MSKAKGKRADKKAKRAQTPARGNKYRSIAWRIHGIWLGRLFWVFVVIDAVALGRALGRTGGSQVVLDLSRVHEVLGQYAWLWIAEGAIWLVSMFFGVGKIRRQLAPLEQLGQTAQLLTAPHWDESRFQQVEQAIARLSPAADAHLHLEDDELQRLETAVNSLIDRMRESYQQQARFVSDASHELRTPISVIQGYANLLDRWGKEDEKILAESIAAIKSESEHMKRLVEQLLFLARGDSGRTPIRKETFSLNQMLREVYEESEMIDEGHAWRLSLPPEEVAVTADEGLIKQTARILVDNARKYSESGGEITLTVRRGADGRVGFSVQDEGVGIAPEDAPHIFERFYRADPARTRQRGGTGLGLSIAKWVVDRHGGTFDVVSRPGLGTRVTVWLPPQ